MCKVNQNEKYELFDIINLNLKEGVTMSIVAEKIRCRCGTFMDEYLETVSWRDAQGNVYNIRNVPALRCVKESCSENYRSTDVQINVSILADEMRKGILPRSIEYEERF